MSQPPVAPRKPHLVERHGIRIEDPYHWLRDPGYPEVKDPEVLAHLEAENAFYRAWMAPHAPLVETLFAEMKGRIKEDDASVPVVEDGWAYWWRFEPGAEYRQWLRRPAGGGAEELLLDEARLAEGKAFFRLACFSPSPDGRLLAYSADETGGERFTLRVKDLANGSVLPIEIPETIDQAYWSADGGTLFYTELNAEWRPWRVLARRLDRPDAVRTVYEESDAGFRVALSRSQSRDCLLISAGDHVTSEVHLLPTATPEAAPILVAPRLAGRQYDVDHDGQRLVIRVNDTHRNFRVVTADPAKPAAWRELIAGSDRRYIRGLAAFRNFLALEERIDGLDGIRLILPDGAERVVEFPDRAFTARLGANPDPAPGRLRLEYSALNRPATTWDYDLATGEKITLKVQEIPSGFDPADYETERLMVPARDGVAVPVSLVWRKGWSRGGPLHLYGYGAYGYGMMPSFAATRISLLDRGVAFAIAHIRGGDELGYGWYEAGKLERRTNTFNDFVDVARHLQATGWAAPGGITAVGGSAGGQLMGVVANQAPELWAGIVAHVPFVDSLNTMLDGTLPLTPPEWPEWGNPIESEQAFRTILAYSPYENVSAQAYPPMMVTAGLNDPRVTYWEPAKWVARLRHDGTGKAPLIFKTNMGAGHGGKSGRFDRLRELAEEQAFLLACFGLAN